MRTMMVNAGRQFVVALSVVVIIVGALIFAGVPLYVFPHTDDPAKTDVVFVLGPPTAERLAEAKKIMDAGLSSHLLISVTPSGRYGLKTLEICNSRQTFKVYCRVPYPSTTQGEAHLLATFSKANGWKSATIVTFRPQITRAKILMQRCFPGEVLMVNDSTRLNLGEWTYQYFYQTGGFIKAITNPGC